MKLHRLLNHIETMHREQGKQLWLIRIFNYSPCQKITFAFSLWTTTLGL